MRDTRQGFVYQTLPALAAIRHVFVGKERNTALGVYTTLTEVANEARADRFVKSRRALAERAGVQDRTLDRYAEAFERIGLLERVKRSDGDLNLPNEWVLKDAPVMAQRALGTDPSGGGEANDTTGEANDRGGGEANSTRTQEAVEEQQTLGGMPSSAKENTLRDGERRVAKRSEKNDDLIERVWAHYVKAADPPTTTLTPSRRRTIERALQECGLGDDGRPDPSLLCDAIDGMLAYQLRKGGEKAISRALTTGPRSTRPLGDMIEWWASQSPQRAGSSAGSNSRLSADPNMVERAKADVQLAAKLPDDEMLCERGERQRVWLVERGYGVEFEAVVGSDAREVIFTDPGEAAA